MRPQAELFYATLTLGFVWVSLSHKWLPDGVRNVLFYAVLLLELVLIVAAWRFSINGRKAKDIALWRRRAALLGAIFNTTVLATPVASLLYMIFYPFLELRLGLPMLDGEKMILVCLIFSLCGFLAGILAPPPSRLVVAVSALIMAMTLLSIPLGVL